MTEGPKRIVPSPVPVVGCNVPAVISTRGCSSCSRGTCISAIAFGSACSYQFGATLGVFSAAELPYGDRCGDFFFIACLGRIIN
jgi:Fe2+ transport system protein B